MKSGHDDDDDDDAGMWCSRQLSLQKGLTYMIEGGRVRAGCGHFHLERGDERVMGGAPSSLRLPPVLTQAPSQ